MTVAIGSPHPPGRKRYTRRQIEQRRLGVWEMICCGQSVQDIANHYSVCVKTIDRDIAWWEKKLGYNTEGLLDPQKAAVDVGTTAARLMKVSEDAYVEYNASSNGAIKARFLTVSMQALVLRHKVLADAGYLPKVGHEKESAPEVKISFEARFGKEAIESVFDDPKSRRKVLEAAFSVIKTGLVPADVISGLPMHASPAAAQPDEVPDEQLSGEG